MEENKISEPRNNLVVNKKEKTILLNGQKIELWGGYSLTTTNGITELKIDILIDGDVKIEK